MRGNNAMAHFETLGIQSKVVKEGLEKLAGVFTRTEAESIYGEDPSNSLLHIKFIGGIIATSSIMIGVLGHQGNSSFNHNMNTLQFRYALVCYLLAMKWISESGFQSAKATTITNDYTDAMYVTYATFFDGILSRDKKPNELYARARKWLDFFSTLPHVMLEDIKREWIRSSFSLSQFKDRD